jgi:hypothetical protein
MIDPHDWITPNGHNVTMCLEEAGLPARGGCEHHTHGQRRLGCAATRSDCRDHRQDLTSETHP